MKPQEDELWGSWDEETGEQINAGIMEQRDDLQAELDVFLEKKSEATAAIAEAAAIEKAAKERFEKEEADRLAAEDLRKKNEKEAAKKAEAARVKKEKDDAATALAAEEARIAEQIKTIDKSSDEYKGIRAAQIAQKVNKKINQIEKVTAEELETRLEQTQTKFEQNETARITE